MAGAFKMSGNNYSYRYNYTKIDVVMCFNISESRERVNNSVNDRLMM